MARIRSIHPDACEIEPRRLLPARERAIVAERVGCEPGGTVEVPCHFCGALGELAWQKSGRQKIGWPILRGLEWDHLVPRSVGGENVAANIVLSCRRCNRSRCNRPADSFVPRGR